MLPSRDRAEPTFDSAHPILRDYGASPAAIPPHRDGNPLRSGHWQGTSASQLPSTGTQIFGRPAPMDMPPDGDEPGVIRARQRHTFSQCRRSYPPGRRGGPLKLGVKEGIHNFLASSSPTTRAPMAMILALLWRTVISAV